MKEESKRRWVIPVAALALTLAIGSAAFAATGAVSTSTTTPDTSATTQSAAPSKGDSAKPWGGQRSDETLLTGDTLAKVQAAAVAEVGSDATVVRVETDADGNASYEVHMVKADNTPVTVYVDDSFTVVSVQEGKGARGDGLDGGGRGHGGPCGQRSDETALTGDTLAKVTEVALAEAGSDATVERAETDADGNATYEAHVTKADGTRVTVYVDDSFQVVSVQDQPTHGPGGHRGSPATDSDTTGTNTTGTGTAGTEAPTAVYTL